MYTPSPSLVQHPTLERLGSTPWWKHLVQDGMELPSEPGGRVCATISIVIVGIWANDCYLPHTQLPTHRPLADMDWRNATSQAGRRRYILNLKPWPQTTRTALPRQVAISSPGSGT